MGTHADTSCLFLKTGMFTLCKIEESFSHFLLRTESSQVCSCMIGIAIKHLHGADNVQQSKRPLKPKRVGKPAKCKVGKAFMFSFPNEKCVT